MATVALVLSCVGVVVAAIAYWRAGGRRDVAALRDEMLREIDALRARERAVTESLSRRIRSGYEDSLARIRRAQDYLRLAQLRMEVSASVREAVDALSTQLAQLKEGAEQGIARLRMGVSSGAETAEEGLAKRVRRLEGRVQVFAARTEMTRAEKLADKGQFIEAERKLEDAVSTLRNVKVRFSDEFEEDPAFADVLRALQEALRSVRTRAEDCQRQIDRLLSASDWLLASLENREH